MPSDSPVTDRPTISDRRELDRRALLATAAALGLSDTLWRGLQLPLDLSPFGAPGCSIHTSHETILGPVRFTSGMASYDLPIPNDPTFVGGAAHLQGYHLSPGANPLSLALTDYISVVIG